MKRTTIIKVFGNILVAALAPAFVLILKAPKVFNAIQTGYYTEGYRGYPNYPVDSFSDIFSHIYPKIYDTYALALILLIVLLLPMALYKEQVYEQGKRTSFLKKWLLLGLPFCAISLALAGSYIGIAPITSLLQILFVGPAGFALYLTILLYFFVDIWVEKSEYKTTSHLPQP